MKIKINKTFFFWSIFSVALVSLALLQYHQLLAYHYITPPGDDPMNHYSMAINLQNGTGFWKTLKTGNYPPLYHYTVLSISTIFHIDILKVILWLYPIWIVLAALAIFLAGTVLFGRIGGLISFIAYGFFAIGNTHLQNDGGYPNLIGTHILLPLLLTEISLLLKEKKIKLKFLWGSLAIINCILVIITHHLSTISMLAVFFASTPVLIIYYWIENKWTIKKGVTFLLGFVVILLFFDYVFFKTGLFASARVLFTVEGVNIIQKFPYFSFSKLQDNPPWDLKLYPAEIGQAILYVGLLGVVLLPFFYIKKEKLRLPAVLILIVWTLFYYYGSRQNVPNNGRYIRDITVPLSLAAGGIIAVFYYLIRKFNAAVAAIFLAILAIVGHHYNETRIELGLSYNTMVRMTDADKAATDYLLSQKDSGKLLTIGGLNTYLSIFLPKWNITSYDYSSPVTSYIYNFDYLYVTIKQQGWLPGGIVVGLPDQLELDNDIILENTFENPEKRIEIFKVIKPAPQQVQTKTKTKKKVTPPTY